MKIMHLWVPVCLAGIVIGCGQKGPLVHPDAPKHKKVVPNPRAPTAPAPPAAEAPEATSNPSDTTPKP